MKKSEEFILCIYVTVDLSNATFITGPNLAQFTLKWETTGFEKFSAISRRICHNLLRKTVGPVL